ERIQTMIGGGYLRDRGTGMSDLVVTSRSAVGALLVAVEPFVIFKREQVHRALGLIERIRRGLSSAEYLALAREVDAFATLNCSKTKRITAADVERHLRSKGVLAPVTTPSRDAKARGWDSQAEKAKSMNSIRRRPLETG